MQNNLYEPRQLPPLPQPGFITQWFLETPIVPAAVLIALGVITLLALRHTRHAKKIGIPALLLGLLMAAGVYMLGSLTVTDAEHLRLRSSQLVAATGSADHAALARLLDQRVRVQTRFASVSGRDAVLRLIDSRASGIISSANSQEINAGLHGPQVATTQIKVRVKGDMLPSLSWWTVNWTRPSADSDQWVATHIEPIWIQGFSDPAGTTD